MKKTILILAAAVMAAGASAQNLITVEKLNPFKNLQTSGKIEMFVTIDAEKPAGMSIDMKGNDPNLFKWWNESGDLQIRYTGKSKDTPVVVRLNCHPLESLEIQTASVTMETPWENEMITIALSSNARLTAGIECTDVRITTQTSATAVINGNTKYADLDTRTKSTLDARGLVSVSALARTGSYSESYVHGTERLILDAFDGGSIFYRGAPAIMRQRTTRGGHLNHIGE